MRVVGDSPLTGVDSILSRTSRPSITRPKTVYFPSSEGAFAVTMKNEVVALAGSLPRAIETMPLVCGVALNSGCRLCTRCCCFSVSGAVVEPARLHHEPAPHAVERRPVEDAGLGQLQEVAQVLGRLVRVEADRHR